MQALTYILKELGGGAAALAILVALIGLIGALGGAFTSYLVSGRSVYINSVTAERSKWIDKLRTNIATYSALLAETTFTLHEINTQPETVQINAAKVLNVLHRINAIVSILQLQLNPWGEIDKNILRLLSSVVFRTTTDHKLINRADELLITQSQWLLKAEWEKVKFEARSPIYRVLHRNAERRRSADYNIWSIQESGLESLLLSFEAEKAKPPHM